MIKQDGLTAEWACAQPGVLSVHKSSAQVVDGAAELSHTLQKSTIKHKR